jgi:hypothetical protein
LVDDVEFWVIGFPDGRVVAFTFTVVFATHDVYCHRSKVSWDSETSMKVKPQIADLEGYQFCDPEATYCCESDHEAVAVVSETVRPRAKHRYNQNAMYRKQEGRGFPNK